MGPGQLGRLHQAPLRSDAIEKGDQVELEKEHRIDGGAALLLVAVPHQVANERQIQLLLQPAVEVVGWEQRLQVRLGEQLEPFRSMTHHLAAPSLFVKASIPPDFFNSLGRYRTQDTPIDIKFGKSASPNHPLDECLRAGNWAAGALVLLIRGVRRRRRSENEDR